MPVNFIENPEIGKVYLIRRKTNGALATRFQPARILEREFRPGTAQQFEGQYLKVRWLTDNIDQADLLEHYGSVKEITRRWLDAELARADQELNTAKTKFNNLWCLRELQGMGLDTNGKVLVGS